MRDLQARLSALPDLPHPHSAAEVLALAHRRRRQRRVAAGTTLVAAAAVALVAAVSGSDGVRARGAPVLPAVALQAAAEGPSGTPRALADGAVLAADEAVVFRVATDSAGLLTLEAGGETVATWAVEPGEHYLGGGAPLAWTPDAGPQGEHEVIATLCTEAGDCASTAFRLSWAP